jgi:hypothetical protein
MKRILNPRSFLAAAALCVAASLHAAVAPAEKLLPDDTLVMFTVPDCAKLRDISKQSPMAQLWNDPAMKPFKEKFLTKLREELVAPLERELGVKLDDYADLAQGQFTLALTANGWQGGKDAKPGVVLLLDARDKQAGLKKALGDFRKKWTDVGKPVRVEKVREVEFMVVTLTTNDVPAALKRLLPGPSKVRELGDGKDEEDGEEKKPADSKSQLVIGRVDSLLIAGNEIAAVERIVAKLTGGSAPALADVEQFQSCQPVFFREAHAFGWANAKLLVDALAKVAAEREKVSEEAPDPFAAIKPEKILSAAGLTGLRNAAFAYQDSAEGPLVQFHLGVPESERKGLLKILAGEAKETTPPPFVPADAVKFSRWRMDGQKTWASLTATLNDISPAIMGTVDFIIGTAEAAGKQKDENFDLRRQLINNLGDDIISYQKKPRGTEPADLRQPPALTLIGSKAPEDMAAALKVMFGALSRTGKGPEEREFLGRKIYTVTTMAGPQLDPTVPKFRKLHLSYSGGYVLVATDEAVLEEYLRAGEAQPKPLREVPGLLEAAARVTGPGASLFTYENQQESQRAAFEMMKKAFNTDTNAPVSGMTPVPESFGMAMPEQSLKEWFDFSLLPPFDAIAKYFNFTVAGGSANADGLTMKVFAPTPPALKK